MRLLFVYIVECADQSFYVGVTNNLERRLNEHNCGRNPDSYTASRRPVELRFFAEFTDYYAAIALEKQIKRWSRAKKKAICESNWEQLRDASKKKFK